jgi:hypothetical protein
MQLLREASTTRRPGLKFASGVAVISILGLSAPTLAGAEDVSALLLRQTQAFSDAGQLGDGATMARLLDDRVVFFNEGGDSATKKDMFAGASPSAPGVDIKMTVTDWNCEVHGDVAVASFIDDQVVNTRGDILHARYRSVETWLKTGDAWRMIGSQTLALQDDPPAVTLPSALLDDYVGIYKDASGRRFTFTRKDGDLLAALDNGPASVQKAEVRDVFFTPGRARVRKVFQRDAEGRVIAFAYRREGHDTVFRRT